MSDCSTNATVVEYGAREMMKGKSPGAAARATAKRLNGFANAFLGSPVEPVSIDPEKLEVELWARLIETVERGIGSMKPDQSHYALDGTMRLFNLPRGLRKTLKAKVIESLNYDPFMNDDGGNG